MVYLASYYWGWQSFVNFCSAALAHAILQEKLHIFGILGCVLCVVGSITIVLHAPQERDINSVKEVWDLATEPGIYYTETRLITLSSLVLVTILVGQIYSLLVICVCSFPLLCSYSSCSSLSAYIFCCPSSWSNKHNGVHWSLFSSGITHSMLPPHHK